MPLMLMTTKFGERYSSPRSPLFGSVVSTSLGMRASDPADSEFCARARKSEVKKTMLKIYRKQFVHEKFLATPDSGATGCSKQLIWIDIHGYRDIFGKWQFVESLAHEPPQTHDGAAAEQNVKSELALQLLQRRRRCVAENELRTERFF